MLLDNLHGNVDVDGEQKLRDDMKDLGERWTQVEIEYNKAVEAPPSSVSVTMRN